MTTTKATMIAITKHETHSYYVIILTFSLFISCKNKIQCVCEKEKKKKKRRKKKKKRRKRKRKKEKRKKGKKKKYSSTVQQLEYRGCMLSEQARRVTDWRRERRWEMVELKDRQQ